MTTWPLLASGHKYTLCARVQVEKMHDEGVQLKVLQTALTLMQSTTLAQNEVKSIAFTACARSQEMMQ